jgi:hypothetical protein
MSKLDKDTVIENFTQAYTQANGKAPTIEAKGGWYSIDGGKNVRLAQLEEMTAELSVAEKPAKKAAAAPKAKKASKEETPAAVKPKKEAAKKPAKKAATKKPAKGGFSVKDFYTQQIKDANPGAKAPR